MIQILLPNQFFWAKRLRQLGVAPAAASGPKITVAVLSRAIEAAQAPEMRERASAIGAKMRMEDGLAKAVEGVHALLGR